jgi:hypothetical protein
MMADPTLETGVLQNAPPEKPQGRRLIKSRRGGPDGTPSGGCEGLP